MLGKFYKIPCPFSKLVNFGDCFLRSSTDELLSIDAISESSLCRDQFVLNIFLVPKSDGSMSFILNLKCLNTFSLSVGVPTRKQDKIVNLVSFLLCQDSVSIRAFTQLVGIWVSVFSVVPNGLLYMKQLERAKFLLCNSNANFDDRMPIAAWVKEI